MLRLTLLFIILFVLNIPFEAANPSTDDIDKTINTAKDAIPEKRRAYHKKVINLHGDDAVVFWKIYDAYEQELSSVVDQSYGLVEEYAKAHRENQVNNELATQLMDKHFKLKNQKNKITKKYLKKLKTRFSPKLAMRFLQAEERIDTVIMYAYLFDVPLIDFE
ncbi:hypothetical protein [Marinicella sp. W31]|uniref:hypothetical protein n=1 Tax=Marinicella sp. W31 TaxID=3023713 RepID=UPI003757AD00